jgi:ribosomal protein S15P/S13E
MLPFSKNESALSPYLSDPNRLADVIAAIQAMATYGYYKQTFEGWADRISADERQAERWKKVFLEHPEFFRLDTTRKMASLVWRRQFLKRYEPHERKELTRDEYYALDGAQRSEISRLPLTASDIKMLVDTAVNLHSRALEHQKDKRWWIPLASAVGALIGSIIGAVVPHLFS